MRAGKGERKGRERRERWRKQRQGRTWGPTQIGQFELRSNKLVGRVTSLELSLVVGLEWQRLVYILESNPIEGLMWWCSFAQGQSGDGMMVVDTAQGGIERKPKGIV